MIFISQGAIMSIATKSRPILGSTKEDAMTKSNRRLKKQAKKGLFVPAVEKLLDRRQAESLKSRWM